jgi:hypothetical protein
MKGLWESIHAVSSIPFCCLQVIRVLDQGRPCNKLKCLELDQPMHALQSIYSVPGSCPVCNDGTHSSRFVLLSIGGSTAAAASGARQQSAITACRAAIGLPTPHDIATAHVYVSPFSSRRP